VKARYEFELSKAIRVGALKNRLTQDSQLKALAQRNSDLGSLVKKSEYAEGEFGFIRDEDSDDEHSYWVFLQVPKHVLKMPDDYKEDSDDEDGRSLKGKHYLFDKVRVAVRVFLEDGRDISYDETPVTVEDYEHPFAHGGNFGEICLGEYNSNDLNKLKKGEAVAKLLKDTRTVLLSGYVSADINPVTFLGDFEDRRITPSDARRRNIPITNVNLEKGRRRR